TFSDLGAEESLVTAAKSGDPHAFEILVKRHEPRILTLALRYTHVREDAEDILQQSFQKAFVYLRRFKGKFRFSTWLTTITPACWAGTEAAASVKTKSGTAIFRVM